MCLKSSALLKHEVEEHDLIVVLFGVRFGGSREQNNAAFILAAFFYPFDVKFHGNGEGKHKKKDIFPYEKFCKYIFELSNFSVVLLFRPILFLLCFPLA